MFLLFPPMRGGTLKHSICKIQCWRHKLVATGSSPPLTTLGTRDTEPTPRAQGPTENTAISRVTLMLGTISRLSTRGQVCWVRRKSPAAAGASRGHLTKGGCLSSPPRCCGDATRGSQGAGRCEPGGGGGRSSATPGSRLLLQSQPISRADPGGNPSDSRKQPVPPKLQLKCIILRASMLQRQVPQGSAPDDQILDPPPTAFLQKLPLKPHEICLNGSEGMFLSYCINMHHAWNFCQTQFCRNLTMLSK